MVKLFKVGDTVRVKPFTRDFGTVTAINPESSQPLTVEGASYNRGAPVNLRYEDVEFVCGIGVEQ